MLLMKMRQFRRNSYSSEKIKALCVNVNFWVSKNVGLIHIRNV